MCLTLTTLEKSEISLLTLANVKEYEAAWCAGSISFTFANASRDISLFSKWPKLARVAKVRYITGTQNERSDRR